MVPVIILGGIYGGIFSPTEAGAVAVAYGFFAALFVYRELNWENFLEIIGGALVNTVLVMVIIAVSGAFSWLLTIKGIANLIGSGIVAISSNKYVFFNCYQYCIYIIRIIY
jgi:C4-dicarboxylate transporter DctM subunit